jgi:NADPH:quinone reductase-like Zn-dependent oxidoreductase
MNGRYNLCPDIIVKSTPPHEGQLAKYITHPARWLHKIPASISYEEGALLEPLSVLITAIDRVRTQFGRSLLITGSGPIGNLVLAVAKTTGVHPITTTIESFKLCQVYGCHVLHARLILARVSWRQPRRYAFCLLVEKVLNILWNAQVLKVRLEQLLWLHMMQLHVVWWV